MWKQVIATALIAALLTACVGGDYGEIRDVLPATEPYDPEEPVETVGVYVDTTPSMRGFTVQGNEECKNYYATCLNEINAMISAGYSSKQTSYYRVDTPLWKTDENVLQKAMNAGYYIESKYILKEEQAEKDREDKGYDCACLTCAVKSGTEEDLFILITDLYENKPYGSEFITALQETTALEDGKVFGLVGIQSAYDGTVHDSGPYGESERYGEDGVSYRPVYVIVRGYPETVRDFCEDLKFRINAPEGTCEISVFEERLQALDYRDFTGCKDYSSGFLWLEKTITVNETESMGLYELRKKKGDQLYTLYFSFTVPEKRREAFQKVAAGYGTLEIPGSPLGEQPAYRLSCQSWKQTALWSKDKGAFEPDGNRESFQISRVYYDTGSGNLYVVLELSADRLSRGIWKLQWDSAFSQEESPWWKDWIYKNGSKDFSKTEHLQDYVKAMAGERDATLFLQGTIYLEVGG